MFTSMNQPTISKSKRWAAALASKQIPGSRKNTGRLENTLSLTKLRNFRCQQYLKIGTLNQSQNNQSTHDKTYHIWLIFFIAHAPHIKTKRAGRLAWYGHWLYEPKVAGSSPARPTIYHDNKSYFC